MSENFAKVKNYYEGGCWTKKQVGDAVAKGWITAEEYREITGENYVSMPTQLDVIQAAVEKSKHPQPVQTAKLRRRILRRYL